MIRDLIFVFLISATFIPILEIVGCFIDIDASVFRRVGASIVMGTFFVVISKFMPLTLFRIGIQLAFNLVVLYLFLGQGIKDSMKILVSMTGISITMEVLIIKMLENTVMGIEQLFMIDTFFGLTIALEVTILSALAFSVKQIMKHKAYRDRMKEIKVLEDSKV